MFFTYVAKKTLLPSEEPEGQRGLLEEIQNGKRERKEVVNGGGGGLYREYRRYMEVWTPLYGAVRCMPEYGRHCTGR